MDCTATPTEPDRLRPAPSAPTSASTSEVDDAVVTIDETSELRWFFDGPLPTEILTWFTPADTMGLTQHRMDSYRVDDQVDVGVKRRFGSTLELKSRQERPASFAIPNGALGQLERWTRWSPADGYVDIDENARWVDVEKAIFKRRFDADGQELPISETTRVSVGQGCDAEIVAVSLDGRSAWSVAFSAFGPLHAHRDLLRTAADVLLGDWSGGWTERLTTGLSCGYPEWLIRARQGDTGQSSQSPTR